MTAGDDDVGVLIHHPRGELSHGVAAFSVELLLTGVRRRVEEFSFVDAGHAEFFRERLCRHKIALLTRQRIRVDVARHLLQSAVNDYFIVRLRVRQPAPQRVRSGVHRSPQITARDDRFTSKPQHDVHDVTDVSFRLALRRARRRFRREVRAQRLRLRHPRRAQRRIQKKRISREKLPQLRDDAPDQSHWKRVIKLSIEHLVPRALTVSNEDDGARLRRPRRQRLRVHLRPLPSLLIARH